MGLKLKILYGCLVFFVLLLLFSWLVLPGILKNVALQQLERATGRKPSIAAVAINPLTLTATVSGFRLAERGSTAPFVAFSSTRVSVSPASLTKRALILREVHIASPYVHLVRTAANRYNFSDLLETPQGKKGKALFSLNNITITNGAVDFDDRALAIPAIHTLRQTRLDVPFISNIPYLADRYVQPHFSSVVNGAPFSFTGKLKPLSSEVAASLKITVKDVDLPFYLAYLPATLPAQVRSGHFSCALDLTYRVTAKKRPDLSLGGTLSVTDLAVRELDGAPLAAVGRTEVNIARAGVFSRDFNLSSIRVDGFEFHLVRNGRGVWNFARIAAAARPGPAKERPASPQKESAVPEGKVRLAVAAFTASGGKVHLRDDFPPGGFRARLESLALGLKDFDNGGERPASWDVDATTARGETLQVKGTLLPGPLDLTAHVAAKGVLLQAYYPYLAATLTAPVTGRLDLDSSLSFTPRDGLIADKTRVVVSGLHVPFVGREGLRAAQVAVSGASLQLAKRSVVVEQVLMDNAGLRFSRESDGAFSPLRLLRRSEPQRIPLKQSPPGKAPPPFSYRLHHLTGKGLNVDFTDRTREEAPEFSLRRITVALDNITGPTATAIPFRLAALYGKEGGIKGRGTITPAPFALAGELDLARIPLRDFDSYLPDDLAVFIADGRLDTHMKVALRQQNGVFSGTYGGKLGISSFYCLDTVDDEDLLKWENLQFDEVSGSIAPFSLVIREVAVNNVYARIIVNKDGSLNLQHLRQGKAAGTAVSPAVPAAAPAAPAPPSPPPATAASKPPQLKIGAITIQDGTLAFSDQHLQQGFSTTFYNLGGRVSGLSSEEQRYADVDLRGNLENHSPLKITGTINPLRDDLFVDLKVAFSDIDLSPITPYSGTYLGYTVEKGKLFLDLKYRIEKKALASENKVFIDQFTFGSKVASDKATNLPVRLAVALLKDRKGEIHLDLPVSGRTDDPQFGVWRVVLQMLKNLLMKAATSPFSLLQSLLGGTENFSSVTFAAGSAQLSPPEQAKLAKLAEVLRDRPALNLEISGYVDREQDAEGYRRELLLKKMKAEKFHNLVKSRQQVGGQTAESTEILPEESSIYLKTVYKKENFPKPRNVLGLVKDLPDEEMKKLILAYTPVGNEQLQGLARDRVLTVKNFLLAQGGVEPQRLFEKGADIYKPVEKNMQSGSRVEFGVGVK